MNDTPTTGQFAAEQADRLLERLAAQAARVRARPGDGAVHDVRVAIRRFSQALVAFQPCFAPGEVRGIRRELKRLMRLAGEVRNCDIGRRAIAKLDAPGAAELVRKFRSRRAAGEKKLVVALGRWAVAGTPDRWRAALAVEGDPAARRRELPVTAGEALPVLAMRFFKRGKRAAGRHASADDLHRLRIAAKKFRYSIELFAELYGPRARRWLEQIAAVQTVLGRVNDLHTVRLMVAATRGDRDIDAALKKRQHGRTREFARLWARLFEARGTAERWIGALRVPPPKLAAAKLHAASAPPTSPTLSGLKSGRLGI